MAKKCVNLFFFRILHLLTEFIYQPYFKPMEVRKIDIDLAFRLINSIKQDNFSYIYRGAINSAVLDNILSVAETNLLKDEEIKKIKKRIFFIIVETLQNITRHQKSKTDGSLDDSGLFILQRTDSCYTITTANVIEINEIGKLTDIIENLNSFKADELDNYYNVTLSEGELSEKGGAGLGLVAIMRKTNSKLKYEFSNIDENKAIFYLRTEIFVSAKSESQIIGSNSEWKQIIPFHKTLIENDILLNFNGCFDSDNMTHLIQIIEKQMDSNQEIKDTMLKIMVELLRNIVKFADGDNFLHRTDDQGNPGIFYLSNCHNSFILTAGNYIHNDSVIVLRNKIDFVNNIEPSKLIDFQLNLTKYFKEGDIDKPDLSILEMKILSKNELKYNFKEINSNFSFFTIQVQL